MAQETFLIVVQQQGAEKTAAALDNIGRQAQKTANIMGFFRNALVAMSAVRVVQHFSDYADAVARMDNRLRYATKSEEEFNRAREFTRKLSRETRTDLETNVEMYARLGRATKDMHMSTDDFEKSLKALAITTKVGGAKTIEAKNALIQFSQGIASSRLGGEELRAVMEQLPRLAESIASSIGLTIGQMRQQVKAGTLVIDGQTAMNALLRDYPKLLLEMGTQTITMAEAWGVFSDSMKVFIGDLGKSTGIFAGISHGIILLAANIPTLVTGIISLTAAWVAMRNAVALNAFLAFTQWTIAGIRVFGLAATATRLWTVAQQGLNMAMRANPLGLFITAIGLVVTALVYAYTNFESVRKVIDLIGQGLGFLWNTVMVPFGAWLVSVFTPAWYILQQVWTAMAPVVQGIAAAFYDFLSFLIPFLAQFSPVVIAFRLLTAEIYKGHSAFGILTDIILRLIAAALYPFVLALAGIVKVMAICNRATKEQADAAWAAAEGLAEFVRKGTDSIKVVEEDTRGKIINKAATDDSATAVRRETEAKAANIVTTAQSTDATTKEGAAKKKTAEETEKLEKAQKQLDASQKAVIQSSSTLTSILKVLEQIARSLDGTLSKLGKETLPAVQRNTLATAQATQVMATSMNQGAQAASNLSSALKEVASSGAAAAAGTSAAAQASNGLHGSIVGSIQGSKSITIGPSQYLMDLRSQASQAFGALGSEDITAMINRAAVSVLNGGNANWFKGLELMADNLNDLKKTAESLASQLGISIEAGYAKALAKFDELDKTMLINWNGDALKNPLQDFLKKTIKDLTAQIANLPTTTTGGGSTTGGGGSSGGSGILGGPAVGGYTSAINRNTDALNANTLSNGMSAQAVYDLLTKVHDFLSLARSNLSDQWKKGITDGTVAPMEQLIGFANGGSFMVGGNSGTDTNRVAFNASRGERVTITKPGHPSGGNTYITVVAADANSFLRSEGAIKRSASRAVASAQRNGRS